MGLKNGASYQLNAPLFETLWKNVIFGDFFAFFLQLTIRPLQRFFIIYLLFSFFCRNFASFFVTNSRGKSETSWGPRQNLQSNVLVGRAETIARFMPPSGIRQRDLANAIRSVPSSHYRENNETQLLVIVDNCWLTFSFGHQFPSINLNLVAHNVRNDYRSNRD